MNYEKINGKKYRNSSCWDTYVYKIEIDRRGKHTNPKRIRFISYGTSDLLFIKKKNNQVGHATI